MQQDVTKLTTKSQQWNLDLPNVSEATTTAVERLKSEYLNDFLGTVNKILTILTVILINELSDSNAQYFLVIMLPPP